MRVFARDTKTARKVKDPGTDRTLPALKSLTYTAIDTPGALAEVTGLDCKLIHGDRQQWMDGDSKTTVEGNYRRIVDCNEYIEIDGHRNDTVYGDVIGNYYARTSCTYWGPVTLTYFAQLLVLNLDDDTTNSSATSFSNKPTDMGATGFQFSNTALSICFTGAQISATAATVCGSGAVLYLNGICGTVSGIAWDLDIFHDKIKACESKVEGIEMEVFAMETRAVPSVDEEPDLEGLAPLG